MRGHDSGVLSLSWCDQDPELLLSCGKDNRTIAWNPQTGVAYGDYPVVTNWTFQTEFNPHNPNLFATASFDGKIAVQTLQSTNADASQTTQDQSQTLNDEDFFSKATSQPQASGFSLPKAPKWLERPVSVSFGFGGRIVSVTPEKRESGRGSKVTITKFEVDSDIGISSDTFEQSLKTGNFAAICKSRGADAKSDGEKADWKVIETLTSDNPRKELVDYLGFSQTDEASDGISKLGLGEKEVEDKPQLNGDEPPKRHKRLGSVFHSSTDGDFLSDLAASKGARTNNPFHIFTGGESEADRRITRALILGQFEKALDVCLEEERMSDAFMIAICGGKQCIEKAQTAYFSKQSGGPNYLRLLASVVGKNLWDTVHNADLENWKEVMATLCTFADEKEFPDLCEALGDRLEEQVRSAASGDKSDASFCYIAGSKLEKVISIWLEELQRSEEAGLAEASDSTAFSLHAKGLQQFIEKVTVFRNVTGFQDPEIRKTGDWKLDALYSKYIEYADIAASHGQLQTAQLYLDLVPSDYPEAEVARSRIQQATKKTAAPTASATRAQAPAVSSTRAKAAPAATFQPKPSPFGQPPAPTPGPYAAPSPAPSANPYAPPASSKQPSNPYASAGGYQPPQPMRGPSMVPPPPQQFGQAPPPRQYNQSPSIAPPSQAKNMVNWNDIPDDFGKPVSRRATPAQQPLSSPFVGQQPASPVGIAPPPTGPPRGHGTPPVAPPPRGTAPPQRLMSPPTSSHGPSAPNPYAPQSSITSPINQGGPQIGHSLISPPVARTQSPYNAPPSAAPPTNRYAPSPAPPSSGPSAPQGRPAMPPPQGSSFGAPPPPPGNPYAAAPPPRAAAASPYAPAPGQIPSHQGPPPPHQAGVAPPPQGGPPPASSRPDTSSSEKPRKAAPPKHRKFPTVSSYLWSLKF